MGLSSYKPRRRPPAAPPTPAMATLDELRERLRGIVAQGTRYDFDEVLRLANAHGWSTLLAGLGQQQRVDLVKRLATAVSEQRHVIQSVADAYDRVLVVVTQAADDEIRRLEGELQRLEGELWASRSAAVSRHRGPSWWTVALAGLGGYWLGRRR